MRVASACGRQHFAILVLMSGLLVVKLSQVTVCDKGSASGMRQLVLYELACDGVCSVASNCVVQSCAGMTLQG